MIEKIKIKNPSSYMRIEDIVEVNINDLEAENVILHFQNEKYSFDINGQIDKSFPLINGSEKLSFIMGYIDPSNDEHYSKYSSIYDLKIDKISSEMTKSCQIKFYEYDSKTTDIILVKKPITSGKTKEIVAFELINEALVCHFSLKKNYTPNLEPIYSGSALSVRIYNNEILHPDTDYKIHSKDKRCMQVNKIIILWDINISTIINVLEYEYNLIYQNEGLVKSVITIATEPFEISLKPFSDFGLVSKEYNLYGRLYRTFSLYKGRNFVLEDISLLLNKDKKELLDNKGLEGNFIPYYYSWIAFGDGEIKKPVADCFLITSHMNWIKYGYGFATSTHVESIDYCGNEYWWRLGPGKIHRCCHFFMKDGCRINHFKDEVAYKEYFENYIGHQWYESILKPVRAEIT